MANTAAISSLKNGDSSSSSAHVTESSMADQAPVNGSTNNSGAAGPSNPEGLSKNARKKMLRNMQKEEEKRLKEEEKERKAAAMPKSTVANNADDSEKDPNQYRLNRMKTVETQKAAGMNLYPHKVNISMTIPEYIKKYENLNSGDHLEDVQETLAGRLVNERNYKTPIFYDLFGSGRKVQVIADAEISDMDEAAFFKYHAGVKRLDVVSIVGFPGKSRTGELSIFAKSFQNLSYCLHMLPQMHHTSMKNVDDWTPGRGRNPDKYALKDTEKRYRQRSLDLILNPEVRNIFDTRSDIIHYLRNFLHNLGFKEAETPILNKQAGGAAARPFVTYHNDLNMPMVMRIAPELPLKQLVIGGIERVYEIGKQFRNEGIDLTHNPEFTTCEFYMAYKDYYDLIEITEQLLSGMVMKLTGGYKVIYHANGYENDPIEIDFTPPFRRIDMIEELEKMANLCIPKDLTSDEARQYLADACTKFGINCPPPQTTTRLLDKLVGHFLEETCVNPTFIMNHPEIMSPLAKSHRSKPGLTERFELFINKHELANAYTELNDPMVQRQRFSDQQKDRQSGDDEAMPLDEEFCTALEYGLPPTAGWGVGIDRLVMLLTDSLNIKEVIFFPAMKPQQNEHEPHVDPVKANEEAYKAEKKTVDYEVYEAAIKAAYKAGYEARDREVQTENEKILV